MANAFTDALGGGASVDEAARKAGMHFTRVAAVDAQGFGPDGAKVGATSNPELLAAIFKAEIGDDGDPFPTQDGHYFAIKVDGLTPPKVKPLDAVRAAATASWTTEQRAIQLDAKATALTARANADHSLSGVAALLGAPLQTSPALNRGTNSGLFDTGLVKSLYDAPAGGTVYGKSANGSIVIARVSGISHPVPPNADLNYVRGVRQLSGEIAGDNTVSLAKAEEAREGTTVNQKLIDSTVGGSGS
jgi:peptidyl-prolyl cis-trans isomerase D